MGGLAELMTIKDVFGSLNNPVLVIDSQKNIVYSNEFLEELLGKSLIGEKCFRIFECDKEKCLGLFTKGKYLRDVGKTISSTMFLFDVYPFKSNGETLNLVVGRRVETRDLAWKTRQIIHDIRKFMHSMISIVSVFEKNLSGEGISQGIFKEGIFSIKDSIMSMNSLLERLALSPLNAPATDRLNVKAFFERIYGDFRQVFESKGIKLILENNIAENLEVSISHIKLLRVMTNILHNAFKFTPSGKEVFLRISSSNRVLIVSLTNPYEPTATKCRGDPTLPWVGDGKGEGLGLYIVKELIEGIGGRVEVKTGEEEFSVVLRIPI